MVLLTTTPQILSILSSLPPSALSTLTSTTTTSSSPSASSSSASSTSTDDSTNTSPHAALPTSVTNPISHRTLISLSRLRDQDANLKTTIPPLNTLLQGTRPYVAPPKPKPAPSPEYVALMTRLREEQEAREYAAMVAKSKRGGDISLSLSSTGEEGDTAEDNISPSLVFNILLSIVMCAVAVFQMTKWWPSDAMRVLVSLATGLVVGVAEVGVYSIYLWKIKTAKQKERTKKERKTLIGEYLAPIEEESEEGKTEVKTVGDKEEIWGRGVNGGMRRRVREKWEKGQDDEKIE